MRKGGSWGGSFLPEECSCKPKKEIQLLPIPPPPSHQHINTIQDNFLQHSKNECECVCKLGEVLLGRAIAIMEDQREQQCGGRRKGYRRAVMGILIAFYNRHRRAERTRTPKKREGIAARETKNKSDGREAAQRGIRRG